MPALLLLLDTEPEKTPPLHEKHEKHMSTSITCLCPLPIDMDYSLSRACF